MVNILFTYDYVKKHIEGYTDILLSQNYINSKTLLKIKCGKCDIIFEKTFNSYKKYPFHNPRLCEGVRKQTDDLTKKVCQGILHPEGKILDKSKFGKAKQKKGGLDNACRDCRNEQRKRGSDKTKDKICPHCNEEYKARKEQKFCSILCGNLNKTGSEEAKAWGRKGGKIAAANQQKRSKGEVYFEELCEIDYGDEYKILSNAPIFDGWDADIIIEMPFQTKDKEYNGIAICYNGVWHYKQLGKKHKLKQVQSRDKIKAKIIKKHNYFQYIVKDMGKFNRDFVEEEFYLFKAMIDNIKL